MLIAHGLASPHLWVPLPSVKETYKTYIHNKRPVLPNKGSKITNLISYSFHVLDCPQLIATHTLQFHSININRFSYRGSLYTTIELPP
jgi:hypothetical protein